MHCLDLSSDAFSGLVSGRGKGVWSGDNEKRMARRLRKPVEVITHSIHFPSGTSVSALGKKGTRE